MEEVRSPNPIDSDSGNIMGSNESSKISCLPSGSLCVIERNKEKEPVVENKDAEDHDANIFGEDSVNDKKEAFDDIDMDLNSEDDYEYDSDDDDEDSDDDDDSEDDYDIEDMLDFY